MHKNIYIAFLYFKTTRGNIWIDFEPVFQYDTPEVCYGDSKEIVQH